MNKSDKNCPYDLILAVREGSHDAFSTLSEMYRPMLLSTLSRLGLDLEEYYSEACLALYKSALTYEISQEEVTFGLYAGICVRHRLLDLLRSRSARESKLESSLDMDTIAVSDGIVSALIRREELDNLRRDARELLSDYEYRVFELWLSGESISATAAALSADPKSVENARARLTRKLRDGVRRADG